MKILLVRHCSSTGQAPEAPLTADGYAQAETLVEQLAGFGVDRIISSPYQRAIETITPFAGQQGLDIAIDDRLHERVLSDAPLPDDTWLPELRKAFEDLDYCLPGGESGNTAAARGHAVLLELLEQEYQCPLLVSHGNLLALLLNQFDNSIGFTFWQNLRNPDVFLLDEIVSGDEARIRRLEEID